MLLSSADPRTSGSVMPGHCLTYDVHRHMSHSLSLSAAASRLTLTPLLSARALESPARPGGLTAHCLTPLHRGLSDCYYRGWLLCIFISIVPSSIFIGITKVDTSALTAHFSNSVCEVGTGTRHLWTWKHLHPVQCHTVKWHQNIEIFTCHGIASSINITTFTLYRLNYSGSCEIFISSRRYWFWSVVIVYNKTWILVLRWTRRGIFSDILSVSWSSL